LGLFFLEYSCWFPFCRIISAISSQRRVRQRTEAEQNELQAKIMDRTVIAERNVVHVDIMVPPLNHIHETIQHYQWTYLYTCACVVFTKLVRLFYANMEVAEDEVRGTVLQSTVDGNIIIVDPQIISQVIEVPVLDLPASPFNEVVLPPSMDELREFFHMAPQGEGHQTSIKIGALGPAHRMLAKIVPHNLWPVTRRSDLTLKKAQFVYVVHVRLPFCLCKHFLGVMLEARDDGTTGLPFGCLLTQIILQSGINIDGEPKIKIKQPLSKQTLIKSNAQLRRDESDDDMPVALHVAFPDVASSSHTVPPSEPEVNFSQVMEALAAIQGGMSTMQQSISSMQLEMRSISKRVEQTHLDLQECLQVHHPDSSDDDVAPRRRRTPRATPMAEDG
jgi:hypothetical protein